jgi:nitrilase
MTKSVKCSTPEDNIMDSSSPVKVAAAQVGSVLFDVSSTMHKVNRLCREAADSNVQLLVFPEALLGGYPKGADFGTKVGSRCDSGRDLFRRYWDAAIISPGSETEQLAALCDELDLHIVMGAVERESGTLYCSTLIFVPGKGLVGKHRKLMPTGSERLIWGVGDGSTIPLVDTVLGRLGSAICWENYMPMYRQYLYAKGVQIWCASTVDEREMWRVSMRHIAYEGRCFVISACQYFTCADCPKDFEPAQGKPPETMLIRGGSMIVSPFGEVLAGPLEGREGLVAATIDLADLPRGKFDLDVAGHYARPDVFSLSVDLGAKYPVLAQNANDNTSPSILPEVAQVVPVSR